MRRQTFSICFGVVCIALAACNSKKDGGAGTGTSAAVTSGGTGGGGGGGTMATGSAGGDTTSTGSGNVCDTCQKGAALGSCTTEMGACQADTPAGGTGGNGGGAACLSCSEWVAGCLGEGCPDPNTLCENAQPLFTALAGCVCKACVTECAEECGGGQGGARPFSTTTGELGAGGFGGMSAGEGGSGGG